MAEPEIGVKVRAKTEGVPAQMAGVISVIDKLRESVEAFTGPITKTISSLKELGEAFLVFKVADDIEAFVEKLEDMATSALKLSAVLGTTVEQVSEFRGVLIAVGGNDASGTIRTMQHLQRLMSESLADPSDHAAQAFRNLGISAADVQANLNNFPAMLARLRQAFQENQQGANTTAAFYAILGRQFDTLVPVLRLTDEEFSKAQDNFRNTASNIAPFADRLFTSGELLRGFEQSLTGVSLQLYAIAQPAIDAFVKTLTEFTQQVAAAAAELDDFVKYSPQMAVFFASFSTFPDSANQLYAALKRIGDALRENDLPGWAKQFGDVTAMVQSTAREVSGLASAFDDLMATATKRRDTVLADATLGREVAAAEADQQRLLAQQARIQGDADVGRREANLARIQAAVEAANVRVVNAQQALAARLGQINATYFSATESAWSQHAGRLAKIIEDTAAAAAAAVGAPDDGTGSANHGARGKRQPPPLGGHGSHTKDQTNYMQQWRTQLDEQLMSTKNYFAESKAEEQTFWAEKLAWTKSNSAQIVATYVSEGDNAIQAQKRYRSLLVEIERQSYTSTKALAVQDFQQKNKILADELILVKNQLSEKTISEMKWFEDSKAIQEQQRQLLITTGQQGTQAYKDMLVKIDDLNKEHTKNITAEWSSVVDWINGKFDTMLNGVLQGTQTWEKAMSNLFRNMATSAIEWIAKIALQWTAFQASKAFFSGGLAALNPITSIGSSVGTALGIGGGGGGSGGQAQLVTALTGTTAAVTKQTTGITDWISQQVQSLAQWLGLTTATTAQTAATTGLVPAIVALTSAVIANTLALSTGTGGSAASMAGLGGLGGLFPSLGGALGGGGGSMGGVAGAVELLGLPALATGAYNIPRIMAAMLHPGEMVIPAGVASVLRSGTGLGFGGSGGQVPAISSFPNAGGGEGGGGGGVSFNIQAIDSRSVEQFFRQNGGSIATMLGREMRNGNSSISTAVRSPSGLKHS